MINAKLTTILIVSHFKLSASYSPLTDEEKKEMEKVSHASALDSLIYLMICTRPDVAIGTSLVSHYMANPGRNH